VADDNRENTKQENQKFRKWMYIVLGVVLIISAFQNSEVNGVNEMTIYMGVAFIIFAFMGSMRKAGWFSARQGSLAEKFAKWLYPQEDASSKNSAQQSPKKKK
jgi:sulfite exporter TauE/SafE